MFVCWSWGKNAQHFAGFSRTASHRRIGLAGLTGLGLTALVGRRRPGTSFVGFLSQKFLQKTFICIYIYIHIYIYIWPICIHMYSYVYLYIPKMWQPKWQHPILEPLLGHRFPCLLMQPILGHVRHEMRNPKVQNVSWEKISLGPSENPMWCHCNITHASENSS